jgi:hypothetical protein
MPADHVQLLQAVPVFGAIRDEALEFLLERARALSRPSLRAVARLRARTTPASWRPIGVSQTDGGPLNSDVWLFCFPFSEIPEADWRRTPLPPGSICYENFGWTASTGQ